MGSWKLLSGTVIDKGNTSVTDYTKNKSFTKIITKEMSNLSLPGVINMNQEEQENGGSLCKEAETHNRGTKKRWVYNHPVDKR